MRVFVLCTGRCGSMTFAAACGHMTNFSSSHESNRDLVGDARLDYPANHIEVDNRLSWLLGRLDETYGGDAYYVHLTREPEEVVKSYLKRLDLKSSLARAYWRGILIGAAEDPVPAIRDMVSTVDANIRAFLKDKPHRMEFALENAPEDFRRFWEWVGAEGDLDAALGEWSVRHNSAHRARRRLVLTVCTRQRPVMLAACLQSIARQEPVDGWDFEVVVVENDVTEHVRPVVAAIAENSPHRISYVHEPEIGIPMARNRGVEAALDLGANWIACVDDDETLTRHWLPNMIAAIERYNVEVITGPARLDFGGRKSDWLAEGYKVTHPEGASCRVGIHLQRGDQFPRLHGAKVLALQRMVSFHGRLRPGPLRQGRPERRAHHMEPVAGGRGTCAGGAADTRMVLSSPAPAWLGQDAASDTR